MTIDNKKNTKKKAMISQPMHGKTDAEIVEARDKAVAELEGMGYEVVNTYFTDVKLASDAMDECDVVNVPLCHLAMSIERMSMCNVVYFVKGWENARGCCIEHDAAVNYGLEVIIDDGDSD